MLTDNGAEFGLEIAQIVKGFVADKTEVISTDIKILLQQIDLLNKRIDELEFESLKISDCENLKGDPGPIGPQGPPGASVKGERGEIGPLGQRGERGEIGPIGPIGLAGRDGVPGRDGLAGKDGKDGLTGFPGKDGINGRDGKDGTDGLGFDDMIARLGEDGRTVLLEWVRGDVVKQFPLSIPAIIYQGVWKELDDYGQKRSYVPGDMVTLAGSLWHCNEITSQKPGNGSSDWTLATKRGRDGKDEIVGPQGDKGDPGRDGRDLTQLGPDGSKW